MPDAGVLNARQRSTIGAPAVLLSGCFPTSSRQGTARDQNRGVRDIALALASPVTAQIVSVAHNRARQALMAATAPATMKMPIVGSEQPGTPAVANSSGTIGESPIQVNGSAPNGTGYLAFKYGAYGNGVMNY